MTDREKLVELIKSAKAAMRGKEFTCNLEREYFMAEYMISHGVAVKEPQKPLTAENLIFFNWEIWREWWIELISGRLLCAKECKGYIHIPRVDYGKAWRCWAEKPTEEERWAAEWEK